MVQVGGGSPAWDPLGSGTLTSPVLLLPSGMSKTYLVPLLCIIVVWKDGFTFHAFTDFPLLQVKLPFSFKVKPVLLVL